MADPFKILFTGPESSGKTTLVEEVSTRLSVPFTTEFARAYLNSISRPYVLDDLVEICEGQLREEHKYRSAPLLLCDTGPEVIRIWGEVKFGKCPKEIKRSFELTPYDITLLCRPNIPWEPDPLREHSSERELLFDRYKKLFQENSREFTVVEGDLKSRIKQVVEIIENNNNASHLLS